MNWSIEQRTRLTFVVVTLVVILIGIFAYRSTLNSVSSSQVVLQTRQILDQLAGTLSDVLDVQASQLQYLVTGNASYVQQSQAASTQVVQDVASLQSLTADDADQQDRLSQINPLVTDWLAQIDQAITLQQTTSADAARSFVLSNQTNPVMHQIRMILDAMTQDEQNQLAQNRSTQSTQREQSTLATFVILTAVMVLLLSYGYTIIHRDLVRRRRLELLLSDERTLLRTVIDAVPDYIFVKDSQLRFILTNQAMAQLLGAAAPDEVIGKSDADFFPATLTPQYITDERAILQSGQPLLNSEEPTTSATGEAKIVLTTKVPLRSTTGDIIQIVGISHDITARKKAEQEIELLNKNLRQQTTQLETANKELEAFSYSVSHDLRAPLRAIDGFTRIVIEEYGTNLAPEVERYLLKVRSNSERMGTLIDDLLRFSRLSRQSLTKQVVEPAALVQQILEEELREDRDHRSIQITVGDLPSCQADPVLLRQVFVNLLSNAVKFTGKRDVALIEVGSRRENGRVVYFVKDNGAGFDAKYANKLFGVFQRLHGPEDYAGTGVGLAIVQRIIVRHGGQIWAEGAVNAGATFYFTLGGNLDETDRPNSAG